MIKKLSRCNKCQHKVLIILFISFFVFNLFYYNNFSFNQKDNSSSNFQNKDNLNNIFDPYFNENSLNPKLSTIPLLENPFLNHLDNTTQFFLKYLYQNESVSSIMNGTYFRSSNKTGDILVDNRIYSIDNILYNWGFGYENDSSDNIDKIKELKEKPLWYSENESTYQYGFIQSTNSTGGAINTTRYLIDNVAVLLPLIENYYQESPGEKRDDAKEVLETQFELLNTSQFWDEDNGGFVHYNYSDIKYAHENFLAVLANILWHRYADANLTYKDESLDFASNTISNLSSSEMWDNVFKGFYYEADRNWNRIGDNQKYLKTNALGIIALTEYYIETGSTNTTPIEMAETIYQNIKANLYNETYGGYEKSGQNTWFTSNYSLMLEDNAWFLMALTRLFKATSKEEYYDDAIDLFQFFETHMYDDENGGYIYSIGPPNNITDKHIFANNLLIRAYHEMSEIFHNTELKGNLNDTLLIKGEETLNLTCNYRFYKEYVFENSQSSFTLINNTENANITFIIRYPDDTILEIIKPNNTDSSGSQSIIFKVNDDLSDGTYSISVYANKSFRATAFNTFYFNVISGLSFKSDEIEGLDHGIYRGDTLEINLTVSSTRNNNDLLNLYSDSDSFSVDDKNIIINGQTDTKFPINITANSNANLGNKTINLYIKNGTKTYLTFSFTIFINQSIEVLLISHKYEVFENDTLPISMSFINYLSDIEQSVKVELFGLYIENIDENVDIAANTISSKTFYVQVNNTIHTNSIIININVSRAGESIYFSEKEISVIQPIEIKSISFPSSVYQGQRAFLIIKIINNREVPLNFTLYINNIPFPTNLDQIGYGENEIIVDFTPSINPFDFETKEYVISIKDDSGKVLIIETFQTEIRLSVLNFMLFYLIPILLPVLIIIYYKNKEIKSRELEK